MTEIQPLRGRRAFSAARFLQGPNQLPMLGGMGVAAPATTASLAAGETA